jgi:uncharacterized protein (DUF433 family)
MNRRWKEMKWDNARNFEVVEQLGSDIELRGGRRIHLYDDQRRGQNRRVQVLLDAALDGGVRFVRAVALDLDGHAVGEELAVETGSRHGIVERPANEILDLVVPRALRCHADRLAVDKLIAARLSLGPLQELRDRHPDFWVDGHGDRLAEVRCDAKLTGAWHVGAARQLTCLPLVSSQSCRRSADMAKKPDIVSDPQILMGKPVIAGTRITVELVLTRLAEGRSIADIVAEYPHLTARQVAAAIDFAKVTVAQATPEAAE